jgi:hypothetical protein
MTACTPYTGNLNDDWLPVTDTGDLFMPGVRSCERKDCVNVEHVGKVAPTCTEPVCGLKPYSQGLCNKHFYSERKASGGQIRNKHELLEQIVESWLPDQVEMPTACSYDDCVRPYKAKGLCFTHYMSWYQRQARLAKLV